MEFNVRIANQYLNFFLADEKHSITWENGKILRKFYYIYCPVCGKLIVTRYADGKDFRIPDKK